MVLNKDINSNKQVARNLVFNTVTFIVNFIISFCFTPYLIKVVGKEAYSFFPLVNNIIGYSTVITAAVGSMAGRFITMKVYSNEMNEANKYYTSTWVANLFLSVIFTILSIFVVIYLDNILAIPKYLLEDVQWLFAIGVVTMILGLLTGVLSLPTYIRNRIDLSSQRQLVVSLVRIGCILLLFWIFRPSIVYMSLSAFIAAIIGIYLNWSFKKKLLPEIKMNPKKYFSIKYVKELINSGIWNSVNQLSTMLLYQLDLFITNIYIGAAATGDFAIAKTAPQLILQLLAMLSGTFIAHFNILYAQGNVDKIVVETRKSMVIVGMLIGLPIGFLMVFSGVFYNLWVPGQNAELLQQMTILTIVPMILGGSINPIFGLFTTTNKLKIPSLVVLLAGLLQTLIILILIKTTNLGIWAIIYTSLVQSVLRNSLFTPMYGAYVLGKPLKTFFPTMFRGIAGMIVVVLISLVYQRFVDVKTWTDFIVAGIVVCVPSLVINSYVMLLRSERLHFFEIIGKKIHIQLEKIA